MTARDSLLVYMKNVTDGCGLGILLHLIITSTKTLGEKDHWRDEQRRLDENGNGNGTRYQWGEVIQKGRFVRRRKRRKLRRVQVLLLKKVCSGFPLSGDYSCKRFIKVESAVIVAIYCCQKTRGLYSVKKAPGGREEGVFHCPCCHSFNGIGITRDRQSHRSQITVNLIFSTKDVHAMKMATEFA